MFTVTARLAYVIRYIQPRHPGGGMARRRTVMILSGEDLTGEQHVGRGNGAWDVVLTTPEYLSDRQARHGQRPWR
jgi:hypothetical protein